MDHIPKIIHWNISKKSHPPYALKKYEDELFNNLIKIAPEWDFKRCYRKESTFFGNTVASWFQYKTDRADIIHATAQTVAPAFFIKNPKRSIVTVHDLAPLLYPSEITDPSSHIQWKLIPSAIKRADHIIAISKFTKDEIIRLLKVKEDKISVIHQGVNHEIFRPLNKEYCKKIFNLNLTEKHILIVSSNLEHKRMNLAQEIIQGLCSIRKDIKILKAGYSESLQGDGIVNIGWITEEKMPLLYNAADLFLHTSEYEGFGLPILEAMACGIPVIAASKASIPEIVNDKFLIQSDHSGVWIDTCLLLLQDIKLTEKIRFEEMINAKQYDWTKTSLETEKIYEKICS